MGFGLTQVDEIDPRTSIHCCLSYTANNMPADALMTLGARASASMVLIPITGIFRLEHHKSWDIISILKQPTQTESVFFLLTHWSRVTHTCICVSKLTIIGSDKGLSPDRREAIIWTNAGILLVGPLRTNFSEILIKIHNFSLWKIHFKMSGKWRPSCLGLNVLNDWYWNSIAHYTSISSSTPRYVYIWLYKHRNVKLGSISIMIFFSQQFISDGNKAF